MVLPTRVVTKPNQTKRANRVALTIGVGLVHTLFVGARGAGAAGRFPRNNTHMSSHAKNT